MKESIMKITRLELAEPRKMYKTQNDIPKNCRSELNALMNQRLQGYIDTMPSQYYWVHRRFKTRPEGEKPVY